MAALLCLAAGGVAAYRLLQKAPTAAESPATETERAEELLERTPFRLPPLIDQHPRHPDPLASPAPLGDSLDPLAPRAAVAPAPIERGEVLPVAGNDGADAGTGAPPGRPDRDVEAAQADAEPPPAEPPLAEPAPPLAEPALPLADTLPLAEATRAAPPAEAEPPGAQPPEMQPPEALPPEVIAPGENCGFITCATGFGCCNPSCGICVAPGDSCSQEPCR